MAADARSDRRTERWPQTVAVIPGSRSATDPDRLLPRGRHDLTREFVAQSQRERLIDGMARTVADRGYAGTSLSDVCTAAGVSTRAFYEHFADKEACFLAAFDVGAQILRDRVCAAYRRGGDWPDRLRAGLGELLAVLAAEPVFASLAVVEVLAAGSHALDRRRDLLNECRRLFLDAPPPPDQPRPPADTADAVISGVYGVIFELVSTGRTAELPAHLPALTYVSLVPYVGRRAAHEAAGLAERSA